MADCNYNCPEDELTHQQAECGDFALGGISSIGLLKCGQTSITDFTNASQYATAIANGDLILIEPVLGQEPRATAVEAATSQSCGPETEVVNYDRELTFMDYNFSNTNQEFYDQKNFRKYHVLWYNCGDDKVHVVDNVPVRFDVAPVIPDRDNDKAHFDGRLYWRSTVGAEIYEAPDGVFDQNTI